MINQSLTERIPQRNASKGTGVYLDLKTEEQQKQKKKQK